MQEAVAEDNEKTKPMKRDARFGHSDQDYEATKPMRAEIVDTRIIKSKGKYDVEAELAASEYPEDFVLNNNPSKIGKR